MQHAWHPVCKLKSRLPAVCHNALPKTLDNDSCAQQFQNLDFSERQDMAHFRPYLVHTPRQKVSERTEEPFFVCQRPLHAVLLVGVGAEAAVPQPISHLTMSQSRVRWKCSVNHGGVRDIHKRWQTGRTGLVSDDSAAFTSMRACLSRMYLWAADAPPTTASKPTSTTVPATPCATAQHVSCAAARAQHCIAAMVTEEMYNMHIPLLARCM
jgi:hypothetical protein